MEIKKIKDERALQLNNKIQSEAYLMVLFLAAGSILVKSYVMDMSFTNYLAELVIIILSTIYIAVRGMFIGYNFINNSKTGKILTVSAVLIISLAISITNGIKTYFLYSDKYNGIFDGRFIAVLVFSFISSVIFIGVAFVLLYWLNRKGQQRIEKKIDEQDF